MRTYWLETLLIAALFTTALGITLAQAQSAVPDYVYDNPQQVVPDYVYGDQTNMNIAVTPLGTTIQVQPLNAPTNPYAGQYSDFDRRIFGRIDPAFTRTVVTQLSTATGETSTTVGPRVINRNLFNDPIGGTTRIPLLVDENGFVIPTTSPRYLSPQFVQTAPGEYTVADADLHDDDLGDYTDHDVDPVPDDPTDVPVVTGDSGDAAKLTPGTESNEQVAVKAVTRTRPQIAFTYTAPLDDKEYAEFRRRQIEAAAQVLPPIPTWLDELHPTTFTLLPNGAVLVPLGDPVDATTVTVYSPGGESLGVLEDPMQWRRFFAAGYDNIIAEAQAKGWDVVEHNGYIVLRDRDTRKIEAVFDWDGKPLGLTTELQPRPFYFTPLRWENVAPVAAQQRAVPAAGRKPGAQQTTGTEHQEQKSPVPDK